MDLLSSIPNFNTDAIIIACTGLVVTYGLVAGHAALVREAISTYVGIVLATNFGHQLYEFASHGAGSNFPVTEMHIRLILLILPVVLLQFGHHRLSHHGRPHSKIVTIMLAVFTGFLVVSSVLAQLDQVTLSHILDESNLASQIYNLRVFWIALVPVTIASSAVLRPRGHH